MSRHGKRSPNVTLLSAVIPVSLKKELTELAKKENRTLSNFVRHWLEQVVRQKKGELQYDSAREEYPFAAEEQGSYGSRDTGAKRPVTGKATSPITYKKVGRSRKK